MDDRGRHLEISTLLLSKILIPDKADGVGKECPGVVGGDEDFLSSEEDVIEVDVVEGLGIGVSSSM